MDTIIHHLSFRQFSHFSFSLIKPSFWVRVSVPHPLMHRRIALSQNKEWITVCLSQSWCGRDANCNKNSVCPRAAAAVADPNPTWTTFSSCVWLGWPCGYDPDSSPQVEVTDANFTSLAQEETPDSELLFLPSLHWQEGWCSEQLWKLSAWIPEILRRIKLPVFLRYSSGNFYLRKKKMLIFIE